MWADLASLTLRAVGEPIAFFNGEGEKVAEIDGVLRSVQELKRSRNKALRVIDSDIIKTVYDPAIKKGMTALVHGQKYDVTSQPTRDGSGGMVVKVKIHCEQNDDQSSIYSRFDRT